MGSSSRKRVVGHLGEHRPEKSLIGACLKAYGPALHTAEAAEVGHILPAATASPQALTSLEEVQVH